MSFMDPGEVDPAELVLFLRAQIAQGSTSAPEEFTPMKPSLCDFQHGQKAHLCDYETKPV